MLLSIGEISPSLVFRIFSFRFVRSNMTSSLSLSSPWSQSSVGTYQNNMSLCMWKLSPSHTLVNLSKEIKKRRLKVVFFFKIILTSLFSTFTSSNLLSIYIYLLSLLLTLLLKMVKNVIDSTVTQKQILDPFEIHNYTVYRLLGVLFCGAISYFFQCIPVSQFLIISTQLIMDYLCDLQRCTLFSFFTGNILWNFFIVA